MTTFAKTGFYLLSLWLLFIIMIVFTVDIPIYIGTDYEWVAPLELIHRNIIPLGCLLLIGFDVWFYCVYVRRFLFKSSPTYMAKVTNLRDQGYEMMIFIATYFLPIFDYDHTNIRHTIVFLILYVALGVLFVKSNLFYNNPTLALLGFRIYKGDLVKKIENNDVIINGVIFVANGKVKEDSNHDYLKVSETVYYLNGETNDNEETNH